MKSAVVTLVHGRHQHLEMQQRSLEAGSMRPSIYVVVAIDDPEVEHHVRPSLPSELVSIPSDPRGLPLAAARNAGVERALAAGAEVVILLDVDCIAGPELVRGYGAAAACEHDVVWSGPVTYLPPPPAGGYDIGTIERRDDPHPGRPAPAPGDLVRPAPPALFWSLSFACHRTAWQRVGGFCEDYVGYGGEDTDFGHRVDAAGLELGWAGTPRAYHQHHAVSNPPVEHLDDILRNGAIFRRRWGYWPMAGWLTQFERAGLVVRDGSGWHRA